MSKKTDELPVRSTKIERNHLELILCGKILQRLVLLLNNIVVVKKCPELTKMTKTKKTTRKIYKKIKTKTTKVNCATRKYGESKGPSHHFISLFGLKSENNVKPPYTGCVWETGKLIHIVLPTIHTVLCIIVLLISICHFYLFIISDRSVNFFRFIHFIAF